MREISRKGNQSIKRKSRSKEAMKKQQQRERKRWIDISETFQAMIPTLENRKGRVRSYKENRMIILALYASLNRHIKSKNNDENKSIYWRLIEEEVSNDFHIRLNYVIEIRKLFLDSGHVIVISDQPRGQAAVGAKESNNTKITNDMLTSIANMVDKMHSEGRGVVA